MLTNNDFMMHTNSFSMPHDHQKLKMSMFNHLLSLIPVFPREYIIACIGTDRSTGDALGPLVGAYLNEYKPRHLTVYGSLHEPIHATNLGDYIVEINANHRNPYIIAVDACLGKGSSIGNITINNGPLKPGAALNKQLPTIGDIHITGVVNVSGFMEYTVLQNTRLSLVVDIAKSIASFLLMVDQQLTHPFVQPSIPLQHSEEIKS